MNAYGYALPDCFDFYLYNGEWENPDFDGCETLVALFDGRDPQILYGRIFPKNHNGERLYIFQSISYFYRAPIILEPGRYYIAHLPTMAERTKEAKIEELKRKIESLEKDDSAARRAVAVEGKA